MTQVTEQNATQQQKAPPQVRLDLFDNSSLDRGRPRWFEALWVLTRCFFFTTSLPWPNGMKRVLLRRFGAKVGKGVVIRPGVYVHFPWRLVVGDHCWIGDSCQLLNIAPITFEDHVALAHEVYLAAGGHDIRSATMAGKHAPILIKTGSWVASRAFIGPGVTVHERVVVGAAAVVMRDVGPDVVVAGNPAKVIGPRVIDRP
jgi:putative colanic acid biosynthesis acetyltransferase WcaF